jgi:hypothetical protein
MLRDVDKCLDFGDKVITIYKLFVRNLWKIVPPVADAQHKTGVASRSKKLNEYL